MNAKSHLKNKENSTDTETKNFPTPNRIDLSLLQTKLLPRQHDAHKGYFGHVLIIGGDTGMAGAVRLSAEAAARVGAGLVNIATQTTHTAGIGATRPEIMCYGVNNKRDLQPLLERATVIVLGPGLGHSAWSKKIFNTVMQYESHVPKSLVIDADGLNLLAQYYNNSHSKQLGFGQGATSVRNRSVLAKNSNAKSVFHWILTPHPGEAARLLKCSAETIQADRNLAIQQLSHKFDGAVCVLKGAGTLVLGNEKNASPQICLEGNPGMATGGMGDVLSGVIGGLVAQGLDLTTAACLGVALHARAGDLAAENGGQRGLLASDLFPYLRQLVNPHFM